MPPCGNISLLQENMKPSRYMCPGCQPPVCGPRSTGRSPDDKRTYRFNPASVREIGIKKDLGCSDLKIWQGADESGPCPPLLWRQEENKKRLATEFDCKAFFYGWRRRRDSNSRYLRTHAFQACTLNHSVTSPCSSDHPVSRQCRVTGTIFYPVSRLFTIKN